MVLVPASVLWVASKEPSWPGEGSLGGAVVVAWAGQTWRVADAWTGEVGGGW